MNVTQIFFATMMAFSETAHPIPPGSLFDKIISVQWSERLKTFLLFIAGINVLTKREFSIDFQCFQRNISNVGSINFIFRILNEFRSTLYWISALICTSLTRLSQLIVWIQSTTETLFTEQSIKATKESDRQILARHYLSPDLIMIAKTWELIIRSTRFVIATPIMAKMSIIPCVT